MELLIQLTDLHNANSIYMNAKLPKRGDVIVMREDDWDWSKKELESPRWTIRKFPFVAEELFQPLLSREIATDPAQELTDENLLQYRGFYFDLNSTSTDINDLILQRPPLTIPT